MPVFTSSIEVTADYPTIKPSLNLNFARSRALDPRIKFTRSSVGTYVGRDGLIKTVGNNEARFDHDPVTLESLGLLIEESRTNQIPVSDFSSGWATSNATLVNGISDPEGGTNARKLVTTTDNNTAAAFITYNSSIIGGDVYTQSVWAKANAFPSSGNAYYVLQMAPSTGFDSRYQNFDLSNGTLGTGDVESATIEAFPDGWYRCSVTQTATNTATGRIAISLQNSPTDSRLQNISTGSANNDGIYVWGAQLEVGGYASSYIPTSGSSVTRAKDAATILGESFNSFYNPNEWTVDFVFRIRTVESNGANYRIWDINNDSNDGRLGALYSPNGFVSYFGFENGTTSFSSDDSGFNVIVNEEYHGALAYSPTSSIAFKPRAGVLGNEDTNVPLDGPTQLQLGDWYNDDRSMNGTIAKFVYYPKRLTNAQLLTITS